MHAGKKAGSFGRFLKDLGLGVEHRAPDGQHLRLERERARSNVQKAREAFRRPRG